MGTKRDYIFKAIVSRQNSRGLPAGLHFEGTPARYSRVDFRGPPVGLHLEGNLGANCVLKSDVHACNASKRPYDEHGSALGKNSNSDTSLHASHVFSLYFKSI